MQVFLPYPDLQRSVQCLDPKRLGNQVYREALTLINGGWPNHPCAQIWANHKFQLAVYCLHGLEELANRGLTYPKWVSFYTRQLLLHKDTGLPAIVGNERFHAGHRAALLAKDPDWYSRFGWTETPEPDTKKAYIWTLEEATNA